MNFGKQWRNKNSMRRCSINLFPQILTEHFLCTKHGARSWGDNNEHDKYDLYPSGTLSSRKITF